MKPFEFWNGTYREVNLFAQVQSARIIDEFKQEIQLQEAVTDKLIKASIVQEKPKVIRLIDTFSKLFKKEEPKIKVQSAEEQARILRSIIKAEKISSRT